MSPVQPRSSVVPMPAWITAAVVWVVMFVAISFAMFAVAANEIPQPMRIVMPVLVPLMLAGYVVLVGYVHGDARRRGMRYVMWMWLAILIPHGLGVILYFIFREPMPVYCSKCGAPVHSTYTYCPHCGAGTGPACAQCHRVGHAGWSHCAWCGAKM